MFAVGFGDIILRFKVSKSHSAFSLDRKNSLFLLYNSNCVFLQIMTCHEIKLNSNMFRHELWPSFLDFVKKYLAFLKVC